MAAASPPAGEADAAGPSGRRTATAHGSGDGRAADDGPTAPPLALDTAPLLAAVGLLDEDGGGDADDSLDTGEVVLREGDEDATYIYVDLGGVDPALLPADGGELSIEDLETAAPTLRLPGGRTVRGQWRETVGSYLFVHCGSGGGGPAGADEGDRGGDGAVERTVGGEQGGRGEPALPGDRQAAGSYLCHTERVLRFVEGGGRRRRA